MSDETIPPIHLSDEQFAKVMAALDRAEPDKLVLAANELRAAAAQAESERESVRLALSILVKYGLAAAVSVA